MTDVLAVVEHRLRELPDVSFELLAAANGLAAALGGDVHVGLVADDPELGETFLREGVETVHVATDVGGYNHDRYVGVVERLFDRIEPTVLLMPHTVTGMDYAPAVASRLDLPLVTNGVDVGYDGTFRVTRKMYGSKVDATAEVDAPTIAITIREGAFDAAGSPGEGTVRRFEPGIDPEGVRSDVVSVERIADDGDVEIERAEFIIGIGLGVGEEENLELVEELCDVTGATLACSKPLVERGWLPRSRQVGQSGRTVSPRVYVAIGISGAIEHTVGMKGSDTIVAINNDPDAPIFDIADYGVVGDLQQVVPELIDRLE